MSAQEIEVATPVVANGLEYNEQETAPSRLQKRKLGAYLYPQQAQSIKIQNGQSSSTIVQFMVGAQYFLDTKSSYLLLNAQVNNQNLSTTNFCYLNPYTESWIQELTILTAGGVQIEKITNANVLGSIMRRNIEMEYALSVGKEALNLFDSTYDPALPATVAGQSEDLQSLCYRSKYNYRYVIEMRLSKFLHSCANYLPLRAMSMGNANAFQIQIVFGSFNNIVTAYNTAPGTPYVSGANPLELVFSNIVYNQALIEDSLKEEQIMQLVKTNPIVISFETHRHFFNNIPALSPSTQTYNITEYQESVLEVQSVFRLQSAVDSTSNDSTDFYNPDIVQEQVQIQPDYYPLQAINCPVIAAGVPNISELYYQYVLTNNKQKCYFRGFKEGNQKITNTTLATSTAVSTSDTQDLIVATNFRVFPDDAVGPAEYIQYSAGLNLKKNPNPIQILMTFNQSPTVNLYLDTFTTYMTSIVLQSNNMFIIS
jgi:hypothetical protein